MTLLAPPAPAVTARNGRVQFLFDGYPGVGSYNLYRAMAAGIPDTGATPYKTGIKSALWIDFGLTNATPYFYRYSARVGTDESPLSPEAAATPAAPRPTLLPYRQTLAYLLRWLIVADALPAINASLTTNAGVNAVQFTETDVVLGDLLSFSKPVMCVEVTGETLGFAASGLYEAQWTTQATLKLPSAMDNAPEDFKLVGDVVVDNLRDLFCNPSNYIIPSLDPATGRWKLPNAGVFHDCQMTRALRVNTPISAADNTQRAPAWVVLHQANAEIGFNRARPLGG